MDCWSPFLGWWIFSALCLFLLVNIVSNWICNSGLILIWVGMQFFPWPYFVALLPPSEFLFFANGFATAHQPLMRHRWKAIFISSRFNWQKNIQFLPPNSSQNCCQKLRPRKLFPKDVIENCSVHNCTLQLLQKVVRKTAPQSCSRNQFSKVSSRSCPKTIFHNPKTSFQNCSQKWSRKQLPKVATKIAPQNSL